MREYEEEDVSSYRITFRIKKILAVERGSTRSHSVEISFGRGYGPHTRQTR